MRDQWVTQIETKITDFNTKVLKSDKSRNLDLLMITEGMRCNRRLQPNLEISWKLISIDNKGNLENRDLMIFNTKVLKINVFGFLETFRFL